MLVEKVLPIAVKRLNTIQTGALLTDAAKLLCETPHKALLVVCNPDGVMVGVISKTDIIRQIAHSEGSRWTTAAEAVMTRDVTYCHERLAARCPVENEGARLCARSNSEPGVQAGWGDQRPRCIRGPLGGRCASSIVSSRLHHGHRISLIVSSA
jgi:CBS domain-containing protein